MTYLLHKPHSFYKAKTMRFSYAQLSLGRYDDARNRLRRIHRTHARHHQCRTGFLQRSNHAVHYYDWYHVLLEDDRRKYRLSGKVRTPGTASNEMCTFLIINISSLQLIPVNVIAYRSQYGSINPAAIVGPGILATAVSTLVAVIYCKCKEKPDAGQ